MLPVPAVSVQSTFVLGGVGLVAGLLGLLAQRRPQPTPATGPGLAPALLGLTTFGALAWATGKPPGFGWPLLALAGLLLLFGAARSDRLARALAAVFARARTPRWQWAALAIGCPTTAALLAFVAERPAVAQCALARLLPPWTAVTDEGRNVPLAEVVGAPEAPDDRQTLHKYGLTGRAIQVAPADWSYDCHGWLFADGRCVVPDAAVEGILQDNGYSPVVQPGLGDLAIYRDGRSAVCHSAQVCAVLEGGAILLESKWGYSGRYVHSPGATPYGQNWTYYHSPRNGHALRIEPGP